jgi:hypothetical protein
MQREAKTIAAVDGTIGDTGEEEFSITIDISS